MRAKSLRTLVTPWTVANEAPLSIGCTGKNAGVGCHVLLQGIFPTQGLNSGLLHYRQIFLSSQTLGKPIQLYTCFLFPIIL